MLLRRPVRAHYCISGYILTADDETERLYMLHATVAVSSLSEGQRRKDPLTISSYKVHVSSTDTKAVHI